MARFLRRKFALSQRKDGIIYLAFLWCLGLLIGVGSFYYSGDSVFSLMRMATGTHVSIVNLLIRSLLPFLFSAFAVYLHYPQFLLGVCFLKAWSFGFVSACCMSAFGSAGWLIWLLMMFGDIVCIVLLWWYWIFSAGYRSGVHFWQFTACVLLAVVFSWMDFCWISPYLVDILEF